MSLAEFGRKELTLAEHEMPGLMNCRMEGQRCFFSSVHSRILCVRNFW